MNFGEIILKRRKQLGLNQKEFLYLMGDQKKSTSYLTMIEAHNEIPTPKVICRMAVVLGLKAAYLLDIAKKEEKSRLIKKHERRWAKLYNLITGLE